MIADTGCTSHFGSPTTPVTDAKPANPPILVRNPNGTIMESSHEAKLNIPGLPAEARHIHILPDLESDPLLSIGQLCDAGCDVAFDKDIVTVTHDDETVLTGNRTADTRLWNVPVPTEIAAPAKHTAGAAIDMPTTADQVAYAHASLFSPALSTLDAALHKGFLINFPGLTQKTLRRFPPQSIPMHKGHLDQARKNHQSTKPKPEPSSPSSSGPSAPEFVEEWTVEFAPTPDDNTGKRTHMCYTGIVDPTTGAIFTDQTGKFVTTSFSGNNYMMILYDYDSNAILVEAMKNKTARTIKEAYEKLHRRLCRAGLRPRLQRLDNECVEPLKQFLHDNDVSFQLAPPHAHRRNAAERAIRTFKNHFVAGLCSLHPDFPLPLWDRLLEQAELTMNLLRGSRMNPNLSAHAQLHGTYDFKRNPIAPPGTRVLAHDKPNVRESWAPHASEGWYVGPALESYRCHKIWIEASRAVRTCDTVKWLPHRLKMPIPSTGDRILASLKDIVNALRNPSGPEPAAPCSQTHADELRTILDIIEPAPATPGTPLPPVTTTSSPTAPASVPLAPVPEPRVAVPAPPQPEPVPEPRVATPTQAMTYSEAAGQGARNRKRREARHRKKAATITPPPAPAAAAPAPAPRQPRQYNPAKPRPTTTHRHNTRASTARTRVMTAAHLRHHQALHGNAFNPDTGKIAEYRELKDCSDGAEWLASCDDEFGRLANGGDRTVGTNTMKFISHRDIPPDKKPTYLRIVAA